MDRIKEFLGSYGDKIGLSSAVALVLIVLTFSSVFAPALEEDVRDLQMIISKIRDVEGGAGHAVPEDRPLGVEGTFGVPAVAHREFPAPKVLHAYVDKGSITPDSVKLIEGESVIKSYPTQLKGDEIGQIELFEAGKNVPVVGLPFVSIEILDQVEVKFSTQDLPPEHSAGWNGKYVIYRKKAGSKLVEGTFAIQKRPTVPTLKGLPEMKEVSLAAPLDLGRLQVRWSAPLLEHAEGRQVQVRYMLERAEGAVAVDRNFAEVARDLAGTSYEDLKVEPLKVYHYRVRATLAGEKVKIDLSVRDPRSPEGVGITLPSLSRSARVPAPLMIEAENVRSADVIFLLKVWDLQKRRWVEKTTAPVGQHMPIPGTTLVLDYMMEKQLQLKDEKTGFPFAIEEGRTYRFLNLPVGTLSDFELYKGPAPEDRPDPDEALVEEKVKAWTARKSAIDKALGAKKLDEAAREIAALKAEVEAAAKRTGTSLAAKAKEWAARVTLLDKRIAEAREKQKKDEEKEKEKEKDRGKNDDDPFKK